MFENRETAAQLLAKALENYKNQNPLVLAIPRGAVPMGRIIADYLGGELDIVLVHKLQAPFQEELAIGSVAENGAVYLNAYAQSIPKDYIEAETKQQLAAIHHRRMQYTKTHAALSPQGRIVIVVDDGIATGSTMIAALQSLRAQHPAQLIVATAVGPADTVESLQKLADQIVCLETHENFYAVGQFFVHFPQISDEEVIELLEP